MNSLPSTRVTLSERSKHSGKFSPSPDNLREEMPLRFSVDSATVSVINGSNHESGMPVRHFNVYVGADAALSEDLDRLEVLNMNDEEFVLTVAGASYPVQLDQVQRVHPSCVCICLVTVSHREVARLPWYIRWFGAWIPRSLFPQPSQLLTL